VLVLANVRSRLIYANVVATLALFIALGGGALAAKQFIDGRSIKRQTIPGNRLEKHAITRQQVDLNALGKVPHAANADSAKNARNLGGAPASDYRLHCPSGLVRAADLCFEPTPHPAATWVTAVQACAQIQRRLPTDGELALVFNNTGAPQEYQWTSTYSFQGSSFQATILSEGASRSLFFGVNSYTGTDPYRCVTDATN
jgi:hypothetical protein